MVLEICLCGPLRLNMYLMKTSIFVQERQKKSLHRWESPSNGISITKVFFHKTIRSILFMALCLCLILWSLQILCSLHLSLSLPGLTFYEIYDTTYSTVTYKERGLLLQQFLTCKHMLGTVRKFNFYCCLSSRLMDKEMGLYEQFFSVNVEMMQILF